METPTLEQIKEYFKNAKEVRCANSNDKGIVELNNIVQGADGCFVQNAFKDNWIVLYYRITNTYAEILTFIDPSTDTVSKTELQLLKEKYAIAKTTLEAVLFYIVPDDCRKMVYEALDELNDKKSK